MNQELPPLTSYSEELRQNAMDKYQVIAPYLKHEESLSNIAEESGVPKRTLYHWVNQYQQSGLKGLIRRKRSDSGSFKVEENVQEEIKKLIFENKKNTLTSIHRKVCKICDGLSN
ncbi:MULTISPECIES: helix-turn-helix domain containing protein [Exiguobacterium]|uniref:helix-turn-helix domain containing protein n=1 Tax=Exiguobacterium TaxID=33986 RepID=UPI001BEB315D|nr:MULTISPECIES: helix-turn-helix domain containing protein [unclassified Exiguobacterium]